MRISKRNRRSRVNPLARLSSTVGTLHIPGHLASQRETHGERGDVSDPPTNASDEMNVVGFSDTAHHDGEFESASRQADLDNQELSTLQPPQNTNNNQQLSALRPHDDPNNNHQLTALQPTNAPNNNHQLRALLSTNEPNNNQQHRGLQPLNNTNNDHQLTAIQPPNDHIVNQQLGALLPDNGNYPLSDGDAIEASLSGDFNVALIDTSWHATTATPCDPTEFGFGADDDQSDPEGAQVVRSPPSTGRDNSLIATELSEDEIAENISRCQKLLRTLKKKLRKGTFLGIISLYGKARFTLENYEHLVLCMSEYEKMPCSTTMRQYVFPFLIDHRLVKSSVVSCPTKSGVQGSVERTQIEGSRSTELKSGNSNKAVLVLPSSWAKYDIRMYHILREIVCLECCRCSMSMEMGDFRIQSSNHVIKRKEDSKKPVSLWISRDGLPIQSQIGTCISVQTFIDQELPEHVMSRCSLKLELMQYRSETCNYFKACIHSSYSVQHDDEGGSHLCRGLYSNAACSSENQSFLDDCLTYLSNLCSSSEPSSQNQESADGSESKLRPGDLLTLLSTTDSLEGGVLIVYVNRFWPSRLQEDRQLILFLYRRSSGTICSSELPSFGVPTFVSDPENQDQRSMDNVCHMTGVGENGQTYYIYRLLLYADDFTARSPLFPRGSVGGVYMSPAGLHVRSRRSQATIRTLSLTPPAVSTNVLIDMMITDLVDGSIHGFDCVDALGQKVKCYFDVIGFIADYPASTAVIDTKGHNAFAPCTHCTFHFSRSLVTSKFSYCTTVNSCNSTFRRTDLRTYSLRSVGLDQADSKLLGFSAGDSNTLRSIGKSPLLKFSHAYNEELRRSGGSLCPNTYPVDGYNLNLIAPDHLLTGLMKGVLLCSFRQLENEESRSRLQICLKAAMLEFGFQSQSLFYTKKNLVPGLTMSMLYGILTVLPSTLNSLGYLDNLPTKYLILHLHKFVCLAFWWPVLETDGSEACELVHGKGKEQYHSALHTIAVNFVRAVDKYVRKNKELGTNVDRPNTHRLIELTVHTIPKYGHILFICELVFESAHQPLKFFLSRNHTSNSHLFAVHAILANDWLLRLWSLWDIYQCEKESDHSKDTAMMGILRLLCGDEFDDIVWTHPHTENFKDELKSYALQLFSGTIEKRLQTWYGGNALTFNSHPKWKAGPQVDLNIIDSVRSDFTNDAINVLTRLLHLRRGDLWQHVSAHLKRGFGSQSYGAHEQLGVGDLIQVLVHDSHLNQRFVELSHDGQGAPAFF